MSWRILIVDDDVAMLKSCQKVLLNNGHDVEVSSDPVEACRLVTGNHYDLLIVDLKMPRMSGIEFMRKVKEVREDLPIIMITAFATLQSALRAVSEGAYDYIPKPFSADHLQYTVDRCMEYERALATREGEQSAEADYFDRVVGESEGIQQAVNLARKVAGLDVNVLLQGESGTGKELFARGLHDSGPRKSGPLIVIDCASLPESLMESELFGYEKGSFTGAVGSKPGLLERASGGTVFFDEVGNISLSVQSKLLRAIDSRSIRRLGGEESIALDIRVISATNKDLQTMILEETFRGDLFYRLNVVPIHLPPLRDLNKDLPRFINRFLEQTVARLDRPHLAFSSAAFMALERYDWPGNARELRNVVERAVSVATSNQITLLDLPSHLVDRYSSTDPAASDPMDFREAKRATIEAFEKDYLTGLLERTSGNVSRASRIAKIGRTALHRLMNKYGLQSDRFK